MLEDEDFKDKSYVMSWSNIEAMLDRICTCGEWDKQRALDWFKMWEQKPPL